MPPILIASPETFSNFQLNRDISSHQDMWSLWSDMSDINLVSLRELCCCVISSHVPIEMPIQGEILLKHLLPEDLLTVVEKMIEKHGAAFSVCPLLLMLPKPAVLLQTAALRHRMHFICSRANRDAASRHSRAVLLEQTLGIPKTRQQKVDRIQLGSFFCEAGWYDEGITILEEIWRTKDDETCIDDNDILLDTVQRLLAATVATGDVTQADKWAAQLNILLGNRSDLLAAAAAVQLASFHLMKEQGKSASRWLSRLEGLKPPLPVDLVVELTLTAARLSRTLRITACRPSVSDFRLQAAALALHHWGQRHVQSVAALQLMADHFIDLGTITIGTDLLTVALSWSDQMFGQDSTVSQCVMLQLLLANRGQQELLPPVQATSDVRRRFEALPQYPEGLMRVDQLRIAAAFAENEAHELSQQAATRPELLDNMCTQAARARRYLNDAEEVCKRLLGSHSVRLADIYTEQGRLFFSLSIDPMFNISAGDMHSMDELGNYHGEALAWTFTRDLVDSSESALSLAENIHKELGLFNRSVLVTRTTLGCLYLYSRMRLLENARRIFQSVVHVCKTARLTQYPDLLQHCLRGLCSIEEEMGRSCPSYISGRRRAETLHKRLLARRAPLLQQMLPQKPMTEEKLLQQMSQVLGLTAAYSYEKEP